MTSSIVAGIIIVLVVAAVIALFLVASRRSRSQRLQQHFGPEYDRRVEAAGGDRKAAESQLRGLVDEHKKLDLKTLDPADRDRYAQEWRDVQADFVDEPGRSVARADELVVRVMRERGYPVDDFDRQADLIAVDHPGVVEHYRAAHGVHLRSITEQVGTEDLRQAFVHYRGLFDELLETVPAAAPPAASDPEPAAEPEPVEAENAGETWNGDRPVVAVEPRTTSGRHADGTDTDRPAERSTR